MNHDDALKTWQRIGQEQEQKLLQVDLDTNLNQIAVCYLFLLAALAIN